VSAPEPVPGPFVLSSEEQQAFDAIFAFCAEGHDAYIECAQAALDRAVRTLALQADGEWSEEDYAKAVAAASAHSGLWSGAVRAGLGAVEYRLRAPAVKPLSDAEEQTLRDFERDYLRSEFEDSFELVDMLRRRFPRPAPKPLHRVAFEASLSAQRQHAVDSEQYWQSIAAAVIAADKAGAQ
jgi:hypothetical protein